MILKSELKVVRNNPCYDILPFNYNFNNSDTFFLEIEEATLVIKIVSLPINEESW